MFKFNIKKIICRAIFVSLTPLLAAHLIIKRMVVRSSIKNTLCVFEWPLLTLRLMWLGLLPSSNWITLKDLYIEYVYRW